MKKISTATTLAVLAALLIVTAALAMFTNGNFESGNFTGWTKDATYLSNGINVGPPPSYIPVLVSSVSGATVTDRTSIVNTTWMDANFGVGKTCDPVTDAAVKGTGEVCLPHNGNASAVVNYQGYYNASGAKSNMNKLTQSGLVAGGDVSADGNYHIFFAYAPVLDKGTHTAVDQPFMHVKLIRVRAGSADKVLFDKFSYPDDGNPNWKWSKTTTSVAYMPWQTYDLSYSPSDLNSGDTLTLEVTAAGCDYQQGGHWGYVYVDDFGPVEPGGNSAPSITGITPPSGPLAGGTTVTITGTRFTGATAVIIDQTTLLAGSFTVVDDNHITFTTPAHVSGYVDVSVTNTSGSAFFPHGFAYVPAIGYITPNSGPIAGGTSVVITGVGLTGGTVTFGSTPATCNVDSDTQITCSSPAHTAGAVNVAVTTPGGSNTFVGGFTYIPTITSIAPNSGPIAGGTTVVITGTGFTGGTVTFDGTSASCIVNSDTQITCTSPAHTAGLVNVAVTAGGVTGTSVGGFTYIAANLTVTASGPATVLPGGQYTYTFAYTTTASVSNAQVAFTLPGHATYASNTGGFACTPSSGVVTCSLGTIAANGSFDVTVAVDKLKKVNTPLTLASTAYSISATGVTAVNGTATVTANTLTPFTDVPAGYWALDYIQSIWAYGITYGCATATPLAVYCPEQPVTRGEMSVFIERSVHTSAFNPGTPAITFTDTGTHFAKYWIEALKADGITGGCGTSATFCPNSTIARVEMAVFLLRGQSWPAPHVPPASTGMWSDVPTTHWGVNWADELGRVGITSGCGPGAFCPNLAVLRSEMAILVQRTFHFTMPSP